MSTSRNSRIAAIVALGAGLVAPLAAAALIAGDVVRGVAVFACVLVALACGWFGLLRLGPARLLGFAAAALLLAVAVGLLIAGNLLGWLIPIGGAFALALAGAQRAFSAHRELPAATAPASPVLFMNPRSGGGKAIRFGLADEARKRGIDAVELKPGDDLGALVRDAVSSGADGLAMAGGDGSQAIVAAIAAEHDLPYACIPAGTRNHLALDLGVDRDDVVGALDAFVDGGERRVDLAEVNGRVFVNNVSLGVYAEAVSRRSYRDAKLRTVLATIPEAIGPEGAAQELSWTDRAGGEHRNRAMILVSNNRYRLGQAIGSGTRPRLDEGVLGIVEVDLPGEARPRRGPPWQEFAAPQLEVRAPRSVPAGIDGESVVLEAPLRFRIRAGALRARIAVAHPGASPSAAIPAEPLAAIAALARIASGHNA